MNLVYSTLTYGKSAAEKAVFDASIAPPNDRDKAQAKANQEAMKTLAGHGAMGPPPPRPSAKKRGRS